MNTSSYLKLSRHNIYIFRRRIPKLLLDLFKTNELRITTRTSNKKAAIHIARKIANESDLIFERLKNNKNMADDKDYTGLNKTLEHWRVTNYLKTRLEEETDKHFQEIVENKRRIKELEATHEQTLAQQEVSYKLAIDTVSGLLSGKLNNSAATSRIDSKLSDLMEDFFSSESLEIRANAKSTVRKDRDSLNFFIEIIGDKFISQVGQPDAVIFSKACSSYGRKDGGKRSVNTVNGYMNSVSKFSGWITSLHSETGHVKLDFSKLRFKSTKRISEEREAFTDEEVVRVLNHPKLFRLKTKDPAKYWLPNIAAYSGARLEEISQLSPLTDIYEENGIWFFDINEDVDKSLKNDPSIRKVPIHSQLIAIGILDFVEKLKQDKSNVLFPNEKMRDGRIGKNAGKRVARFIQKDVGISNKSLHSFRHTLATILKRALLDEGVAAAIMGHEHGGITYKRYGKNYLPETLKDAVEKIRFD